MKIKTYISFCALVVAVGCTSTQKEVAQEAPELVTIETKIEQADEQLKQKNYAQALILYSEAQGETSDVKLFRRLQLKIAETQYEMRNYSAALATLAPMPELPATLNDCQKLVMAARILQQMNSKPEYIEALLEVALDNSIDEPGTIPFKAFGYAELGKVYVINKKTTRAIKCFEYAAKLYKLAGDDENAAICKNIMEYLR